MVSRSTALKVGIVVLGAPPLMYFLIRPPDSNAVLGVFVGFVLLLVSKQIFDELRGGTDSLTLFSTVLFTLGGALSLVSRLASFGDETAVTLGALTVILLAAMARGVAWVRNDRSGDATV